MRRRPGSRSSARSRATRVSSRARCSQGRRAALGERDLGLRFAARLEAIGIGKTSGSRFAPASESVTRSPLARSRRRRARSRRWHTGRVRRCRLEPERLLHRRWRGAVRRPDRSSAPGVGEQVQKGVRDHRLARLDPAEHSTAAFDATSSRLRPPASLAAAATRDDSGSRSRAARPTPGAARTPPSAPVRLLARRGRPRRRCPRTTPSASAGSVSSRPIAATIASTGAGRRSRRGGRRCRAARCGRATRRRAPPPRSRSARGRRRAGTARERVTVTPVLLAVEREHARADDLRRREARVVDRERARVAHCLQDLEVAPRH